MSSSNERLKTIKKSRKQLPAQAREIISNVTNYLQQDTKNGLALPIRHFKQRAVDAIGITDATYCRIVKEAEKIEKGLSKGFATPKRSIRKNNKTEKAKIIRDLIHNYYVNEKKPPSIHGLRAKIKAENIQFVGGSTTLYSLLREIGFQWASTKTKWKVLIESNVSRYKRINYLRQLFEYREQNRPIVYIDERYIDGLHAFKIWRNDTADFSLTRQINRNRCLIVIYAGGEMGTIPNSLLVFITELESIDCYDDINNSQIFLKWVEQQLLPNLYPRSVLVIDNIYENIKTDELIFTKNNMIEWLQKRNVPCNSDMTKAELNTLIKNYRLLHSNCKLNELLEKYGHNILKLPTYHPELSPEADVWDSIQNWLLSKPLTFRMEDIQDWVQEKLNSITKYDWIRLCDHVKEIETEYMKREDVFDKITDGLQILMESNEEEVVKDDQAVEEIMEVEEISDDEAKEEQCGACNRRKSPVNFETVTIKREVNDDEFIEINEWKPPVNVCSMTVKDESNSKG